MALQAGTYTNISTNTTTTVRTGRGILRRIVVNTKGASANVATVYDNTTNAGTVIGIIDTTAGPSAFVYDCMFFTGLTVAMATGTAANLTVVTE